MKDADVFEPVDVFELVRNWGAQNRNVPSFSDLSHVVAVTLVKIRMLLTLQAIGIPTQASRPSGTHKSASSTYLSPIVVGNPTITHVQNQKANIEKLQKQIKKLYNAVNRINTHFWPGLLQPGGNLTATPYSFGMGDKGEMQNKLQECYNAWVETPGSIEFIRKLAEE